MNTTPWNIIIILIFLQKTFSSVILDTWAYQQRSHRSQSLNSEGLQTLISLSDRDHFKYELLRPMLITRVPGSKGNLLTQQHIKSHMTQYGWAIEEDAFKDSTPFGEKDFTNIIATHNPRAPRTLTLACHFDSKYFEQFEFIGATDSAVPCAMLLDLARVLQPALEVSRRKNDDVSLQFLFFDGEEAFQHWTDTDSIYGARHLADKMHKRKIEVAREVVVTQLQTMDALVLLDLIGAPNPVFKNWFPRDTGHLFQQLQNIETALYNGGHLTTSNYKRYFDGSPMYGSGIQDDHIPFLNKKVSVLHLISYPFPSVWHKQTDNESALDYDTIDNLNKILRVFVAQYLHLIP